MEGNSWGSPLMDNHISGSGLLGMGNLGVSQNSRTQLGYMSRNSDINDPKA